MPLGKSIGQWSFPTQIKMIWLIPVIILLCTILNLHYVIQRKPVWICVFKKVLCVLRRLDEEMALLG